MDKRQKQQQEIRSMIHAIYILKAMHLIHHENTDVTLQGHDDEFKQRLALLEMDLENKEKALKREYGIK